MTVAEHYKLRGGLFMTSEAANPWQQTRESVQLICHASGAGPLLRTVKPSHYDAYPSHDGNDLPAGIGGPAIFHLLDFGGWVFTCLHSRQQ